MAGITAGRSSSQTSFEDLARDFWWNGFVVLKGIISAELVEEVRGEIDEVYEDKRNRRARRVQDTWEIQRGTREVATAEPLLETLRFFYGRRPIPYQTLSFLNGSQQKLHTDCWHGSTMPSGFVCSAWTAIERADADSGPLYCYPGSHHLEELTPQRLASITVEPGGYEAHQRSLMESLGYERHLFQVDPGDVVVFAGNLAHGGSPIVNPEKTRRSIVTQYFFDGCVYYTPRHSDVGANEIMLRDSLVDISTGRPVKHSYEGRSVAYYRLEGVHSRVFLNPTVRQRASSWLHEARFRFPLRRARRNRAREQEYRQAHGLTIARQTPGG